LPVATHMMLLMTPRPAMQGLATWIMPSQRRLPC
jgi:hypothetical protein